MIISNIFSICKNYRRFVNFSKVLCAIKIYTAYENKKTFSRGYFLATEFPASFFTELIIIFEQNYRFSAL